MKKKEGNICKIMYNSSYEYQDELHKLMIEALEQVAWQRGCDIVKIPSCVDVQVAIDLDYVVVIRKG